MNFNVVMLIVEIHGLQNHGKNLFRKISVTPQNAI